MILGRGTLGPGRRRVAAAIHRIPTGSIRRLRSRDRPQRFTDRLKTVWYNSMAVVAATSILMICPLSAESTQPPSTLTQAMRMVSEGAASRRWSSRRPSSTAGDETLPNLLGQLSSRHGATHFLCPDAMPLHRLKALITHFDQTKPALRLAICCDLDDHLTVDFDFPNHIGVIVSIQWRLTRTIPGFRFFRSFSRAGIWNHLVLDGLAASPQNLAAVASQPNLIHSWEASRKADRDEPLLQRYGSVRPLPGRPLWRAVTNPVHRFLLLDRFGSDWLSRARVDDSGDPIFCLGQALEYHFCAPGQLPPGYLDEICAMVKAGGTVGATHVRSNLERAFLIGYALEKGVIVGNSSLKNPRAEYIEAVRHQSGLNLSGFVERGYTSVRPEYRGLGIGTKLLEGLTARAGDRKIFSVIAEDNTATQTIAIRNHTRKVATYFSPMAGKQVAIWMPARMIDGPDKGGLA